MATRTPLPAADYIVHDVTRHPIVHARVDAVRPGYAAQWAAELTALMDLGQPFVIVYAGHRDEEEHEDRKQRGLWLKTHKQELARTCRGLIVVEADPERRAQISHQAAGAERAFGIRYRVTAGQDEVDAMAADLLASPLPGDGAGR